MPQRKQPTGSRFDPRSKRPETEANSPEQTGRAPGITWGRPVDGPTRNYTKPKPEPEAVKARAVSRSGRPGRPAYLPMPEDPELERLARLAIDWPRVSLDVLAEGCGSSVPSLAAYRGGDRRIPPEVLRRLARWIVAHAKEGIALAGEIDALADKVSR